MSTFHILINLSILAILIWLASLLFFIILRIDKVSSAFLKEWSEKELESEIVNVINPTEDGHYIVNQWEGITKVDLFNPKVQKYQQHLNNILKNIEDKDPDCKYQVLLLQTKHGLLMFFFKLKGDEKILDYSKINLRLDLGKLKDKSLFYLKEDTPRTRMELAKDYLGDTDIPKEIEEDVEYIRTQTTKIPLHYRKSKYNNFYYVFDLSTIEVTCPHLNKEKSETT